MTVPVVMHMVMFMLVGVSVLVSEIRAIKVRVLADVIAENGAVGCA